jgi:hypothetical protein
MAVCQADCNRCLAVLVSSYRFCIYLTKSERRNHCAFVLLGDEGFDFRAV